MSTLPAAMDEEPAAETGESKSSETGESRSSEIAHAALRGTIAAMAMTGMRSFTVSLGLVEEPPPRAILRQKTKGLFRIMPKRYRRAGQELLHWGFGAAGGVGFALLPGKVRLQPWAGPVWGVAIWLGFEIAAAPALGLKQAKKPRPIDRAMLAVDHLVYGLVLSELRRRPRE